MDKLNICFDGRVLYNGYKSGSSRTGIYFVAKNIVQELSKRDINLYLYFEEDNKNISRIISDLDLKIDKSNVFYPNSDFSYIDSFFSPVFAIPDFIDKFQNVSQYTVLYDLIPLLFPEYFEQCSQDWLYNVFDKFNNDKYYFLISQHSKEDFLKYFPDKLDKDKMKVISLSTNSCYKQNTNNKQLRYVKEKYNIPVDKKYLFSLCSLEPRKNLIRTIKTFVEFINKNNIDDLIYVLGGGAWEGFIDALEKEFPDYKKYEDKIIRTGYVDDEDLEILYSNAEWFIYTSEYEGFGMPPLEAMSCGCPVITSNNSSLPEVVGDCAITIDFDSDIQHVEAYEKYYYNEDLRRDMSQKGIDRAKLFSWEKCVDIILNTMYSVEKKKKSKPLVTVITPTFNLIKNGRKDYFIQNIESVKNQTYSNIEHIIIDGVSSDGTLELLEEYQNKKWIKYYFEPDKGIYDAINKGILKANGKYVVCLNSDDFYCSNKAIELEVMKLEENDADACYANTQRVNPQDLSVMCEWGGKENFYPLFGSAPCHQSFMIKTEVMKELGLYDLKYRVSSDNNFIIRMIQNGKKFVGIDVNIVNFRDGGFSNENFDLSYTERVLGFWKEYGQYHRLTKQDSRYLFGHKFKELPLNKAIELGCNIDNSKWQKKYFEILFRYHCENNNQSIQPTPPMQIKPYSKNVKLLGCLLIFKYKQDKKNKKWYFCGLPVFRIKQKNEFERKYYIFAIPVLKIMEKY